MKLSDELYHLTEEVPAFVYADAGGAWRAAGVRRRRRRLGAAVAFITISVLVLAWARGLGHQGRVAPATDQGFGPTRQHTLTLPTRIERPYLLHDLPNRAGRLAGVLWGEHQWLAVSPTGYLWRLPLATDRGYMPAISPDGSSIAFLQDFPTQKHSRLLVLSTTTGHTRVYSQIGTGITNHGTQVDPATRFWIQDASPAYFSPNGSYLVVDGGSIPSVGGNVRALLLHPSRDGDVTVLDSPPGTTGAFPAGWLATHLVWIEATAARQSALVTTLTGDVVRSINLTMPQARAGQSGQWVGPVSLDGLHVAYGSGDESSSLGPVLTFALNRDPSSSVATASPARPAMNCPTSWGTSSAPAIPQASPTLLPGNTGVVADPRLHVECAIWASEALTGARHQGIAGTLFGHRTAWWTWWWRELALGLTTLGAGGFYVWRRRRN